MQSLLVQLMPAPKASIVAPRWWRYEHVVSETRTDSRQLSTSILVVSNCIQERLQNDPTYTKAGRLLYMRSTRSGIAGCLDKAAKHERDGSADWFWKFYVRFTKLTRHFDQYRTTKYTFVSWCENAFPTLAGFSRSNGPVALIPHAGVTNDDSSAN